MISSGHQPSLGPACEPDLRRRYRKNANAIPTARAGAAEQPADDAGPDWSEVTSNAANNNVAQHRAPLN
jgi:hypothetical protein